MSHAIPACLFLQLLERHSGIGVGQNVEEQFAVTSAQPGHFFKAICNILIVIENLNAFCFQLLSR